MSDLDDTTMDDGWIYPKARQKQRRETPFDEKPPENQNQKKEKEKKRRKKPCLRPLSLGLGYLDLIQPASSQQILRIRIFLRNSSSRPLHVPRICLHLHSFLRSQTATASSQQQGGSFPLLREREREDDDDDERRDDCGIEGK
jgi:hypothetical protein